MENEIGFRLKEQSRDFTRRGDGYNKKNERRNLNPTIVGSFWMQAFYLT